MAHCLVVSICGSGEDYKVDWWTETLRKPVGYMWTGLEALKPDIGVDNLIKRT